MSRQKQNRFKRPAVRAAAVCRSVGQPMGIPTDASHVRGNDKGGDPKGVPGL